MALCTDFLGQYIRERGPWLYHVTSRARAERILREGLRPWDDGVGTHWQDEAQPRPGHVYLSERSCLTGRLSPERLDCALLVDLRTLDPAALNPDEDAFLEGGEDHRCARLGFGDPDELLARYGSGGAWAEAVGLGENPDHTRISLQEFGAVAHRGAIPACALAPANGIGPADIAGVGR